MNPLYLSLVVILAGTAIAQDLPRTQDLPSAKGLTIDNVCDPRAAFYGADDRIPAWADGGKLLEFGAGANKQHLDATTLQPAAPPKVAASFELNGRRIVRNAADGTQMVVVDDATDKHEVHASESGTHVAYVGDNNLVIVDAAGKPWQVTNDGGKHVLNGRLDWVYQEEVYGRGNFRGHWWSGDGKWVAFLRLDQKDVIPFTIVDHVNKPLAESKVVTAEPMHYPKAGDPNPHARLFVANVEGRSVSKVDLSKYPQDCLIVRVGFAKDSQRVIFQVQDRIQTWLELVAADPATGKVTTLLREESKTWVNVLEEPKWLADGSFLWLSERTGYKHIYHCAPDGKVLRQVTTGDWQVRSLLHVDEERAEVWFSGTKDGVIEDHAYRIALSGKGLVRVTEGRGWHKVAVRPDGSGYIESWSNVEQPACLRLCDRDGKVVRNLRPPQPPAPVRQFGLIAKKLLRVKTRDGRMLDATLIGKDHDKPAPIWLDVYGGPDLPSVHDRWGIWGDYDAFHQFLAQQGLLVVQVNVRSASGAGQIDTQTCYQSFGKVELADIEDTVAKVVADHKGDASRVGITGWSYGGFMTAYALTHSGMFKLGVAGAGVYDWRLYDTIYTERYMRRPQDNPDGYRASSVIEAAADLKGHLVLVHGTQDDNVHLQNTMCLVYALQRAGKPFDLMLYPKTLHSPEPFSFKDRHRRAYVWRIIKTHLL